MPDKLDIKLRNSRQETMAPYEKLINSECVVIGVGAVGRQVARQLASMGVKSLSIWDHDTVEIENLAPQGYAEVDLGRNKAEVTAQDCKALNSNVDVGFEKRRFARSDFRKLAGKNVFMCVDSIETRSNIFESAVKAGASWIGDTRVAGEVVRVISQDSPKENSKYKTTLFAQNEAFSGSCHGKMFGPGANLAASTVVAKFTQKLRNAIDEFTDININMSEWDLF